MTSMTCDRHAWLCTYISRDSNLQLCCTTEVKLLYCFIIFILPEERWQRDARDWIEKKTLISYDRSNILRFLVSFTPTNKLLLPSKLWQLKRETNTHITFTKNSMNSLKKSDVKEAKYPVIHVTGIKIALNTCFLLLIYCSWTVLTNIFLWNILVIHTELTWE